MLQAITMEDIQEQLSRLSPSQSDDESGYISHPDTDTIGWYTARGNVGHPILQFHREDAKRSAYLTLAMLDDAELDSSRRTLRDVLRNIPGCDVLV